MVDEQTGSSTTPGETPDLGWHPVGVGPSDPGWYPAGSNPNDQAYWDGQTWAARRHWSVNGWVEEGSSVAAPVAGPSTSGASRYSANPYTPPSFTRQKSTPVKLNFGILLLFVCAIALMFGSVGSWVQVSGSVSIASFHASFHSAVNGIDPGISSAIVINGYVTFIAGIVLLVFAGLAMTNDDLLLAIVTFVVSALTLAVAIYDMFRIVQKISQVAAPAGSSVTVGAGLICVLSAAVLAMIVVLVRLLSR
jgi:hypothetical protein